MKTGMLLMARAREWPMAESPASDAEFKTLANAGQDRSMSTNPLASWLGRIRIILVCLAIAAIAGLEFRVSKPLAARFGQVITLASETMPVPNASLADLMNAAH
jgi:hypothetical protein